MQEPEWAPRCVAFLHGPHGRRGTGSCRLPAKLSVPLTLCVFPVVIIVIMLPVYVKLKLGAY